MDPTTGVLVLAWVVVVVPRLLQSVLSPKARSGVGEPVASSSIANAAELGASAALIAACLTVVVSRHRRLPTDRRVALLVLLLPWLYVVGRDLYAGYTPRIGALLYPALVVALWVLRPPVQRFAAVGVLASATATISIALAVVDPGKGIFISGAGSVVEVDKEILPIGLLIGPFTSANNLGQILALGAPFLLLLPRRDLRLLLVLPVLLALVWTASRSSLAAAGVALVAVVAIGLLAPHRRRIPTIAVLAASAAAVVVLPLTGDSPSDYTNRGLIWSGSLAQWRTSPVTGLGSRWFSEAAAYTESIARTAFHAHNQFIHILVTTGAVGAVMSVGVIGYLIVVAARWAERGVLAPIGFLVALFASCTLEVGFGLVDRDFLIATTIVGTAAIALADRRGQPATA